jgi:hypothetical protein
MYPHSMLIYRNGILESCSIQSPQPNTEKIMKIGPATVKKLACKKKYGNELQYIIKTRNTHTNKNITNFVSTLYKNNQQ